MELQRDYKINVESFLDEFCDLKKKDYVKTKIFITT